MQYTKYGGAFIQNKCYIQLAQEYFLIKICLIEDYIIKNSDTDGNLKYLWWVNKWHSILRQPLNKIKRVEMPFPFTFSFFLGKEEKEKLVTVQNK